MQQASHNQRAKVGRRPRLPWARRVTGGFAGLLILCAAAPADAAESVRSPNSLAEVFAFLRQCVALPPGSDGAEITLRFGLTHYGALKGKPMITHSRLVGDLAARKAFVAASLAALENCTPVPVTETFGRIVAQQVLTWRIRSGREQQATRARPSPPST